MGSQPNESKLALSMRRLFPDASTRAAEYSRVESLVMIWIIVDDQRNAEFVRPVHERVSVGAQHRCE